MIELIVNAGEGNATDPDEIDKLTAQPLTVSYSKFSSMMNVWTDYCQLQDCVTTGDMNLLRMLQAKVADAAAPSLKQALLGVLTVSKLYVSLNSSVGRPVGVRQVFVRRSA